jgi:hypothetical protein
MVISNFYNIPSTLTKGSEGGFKDGRREGNVAMTFFLKSVEDPARLQWHEVQKVDHYYLSIDAVTQPMQVKEGQASYGKDE